MQHGAPYYQSVPWGDRDQMSYSGRTGEGELLTLDWEQLKARSDLPDGYKGLTGLGAGWGVAVAV